MKNTVYCLNFPSEIELDLSVLKKYRVKYFDLPVTKYHLYSSQALFVFNHFDETLNTKYYKDVTFLDNKKFLEFQNNPMEFLDLYVGREKLINPKQSEILKGSIVRSKVDVSIGAGVVQGFSDDLVLVKFPKAKEIYDSEIISCHPSVLRVVTHIEEVLNDKK